MYDLPDTYLSYIQTLPARPVRRANAHKGDFGKCCIIGGSCGMAGAVSLAGQAAIHCGAGLVQLAVPANILPTVASFSQEIMTYPLPEDRCGRISLDSWEHTVSLIKTASTVAVGPGMGQSLGLRAFLRRLIRHFEKYFGEHNAENYSEHCTEKTVVFDADALNGIVPLLIHTEPFSMNFPAVWTPHPGEFARLSGQPTPENDDDRLRAALSFAAKYRIVLVLKGYHTVITDGQRFSVNPSGNPGMATAGSGDVLTGVITSFVGQKMSPYDAAVLGTFVHGLAGDIAVKKCGQDGLCASDILRALPAAIQTVKDGTSE